MIIMSNSNAQFAIISPSSPSDANNASISIVPTVWPARKKYHPNVLFDVAVISVFRHVWNLFPPIFVLSKSAKKSYSQLRNLSIIIKTATSLVPLKNVFLKIDKISNVGKVYMLFSSM